MLHKRRTRAPGFLSTACLSLALCALPTLASGQEDLELYSVEACEVEDGEHACEQDPEVYLRRLSLDPASTVERIAITLGEQPLESAAGLATHPKTGVLYAGLVITDQPGRELVMLDPATGVARSIGDTGLLISALAFDSEGTLYAMTDELSVPFEERLYTLDLGDATPTYIMNLPAGDFGDALAYNPEDGLLYHASGHFDPCAGTESGVCFESVDLSVDPAVVTNIPTGGDTVVEQVRALTWWAEESEFIWARGTFDHEAVELLAVSAEGTDRYLGLLDHDTQGIAFVPEPGRALLELGALLALVGFGRRRASGP